MSIVGLKKYFKPLTGLRPWLIVSIVCPVLLLAIDFILSPALTNMNLIKDEISNMALGNYWWLGTIYFIITALLLFALARSLSAAFPFKSSALPIAIWSFYLAALFSLILTLVRTDPVHGLTMRRVIHWTIASGAIIFYSLAIILLAGVFKRFSYWRRFRNYTLVVGIISMVLAVSIPATLHLLPWTGLEERLFMVNGIVWVELLCIRLLKMKAGDMVPNIL